MAEANEQAESTGNKAKFIAKVGVLYSGVVALVSDILQPLLDFTLLFLCLSGLMLAAEILLGFYTKSARGQALNKKLLKLTDGYWFKPILGATILSFCVLSGMYLLNEGTEDGLLAEKSEAVRKLQDSLGLMNASLDNIERNLNKASGHAGESARNLEHAATDSRHAVELLRELHESSDARKRLAQQGLRFDSRHFAFTLMDGELEAQKLFYEAGMTPEIRDSQGGMPIFSAILNDSPNWRKSLVLAIREGNFNPNKPQRVLLDHSLDPGIYERRLTKWLGGDSGLFAFFQPGLPEGAQNLDAGSFIALSEPIPSSETLKLIEDMGLDMKNGAALREKLAEQYENYAHELANELNRFWICEAPRARNAIPQQINAYRQAAALYGLKSAKFRAEAYDVSQGNFAKSISKEIEEPLETGIAFQKQVGWCPLEYLVDGFLEYRTGFWKRDGWGDEDIEPGLLLKKIQRFREKTAKLDIPGFRKRLAEYRSGTSELLKASKKSKQEITANVR